VSQLKVDLGSRLGTERMLNPAKTAKTFLLQITVSGGLRASSSQRRWIIAPNDFLIVEADFDSRLEHGEKWRDVEIARSSRS
jgi:hypothetical protein